MFSQENLHHLGKEGQSQLSSQGKPVYPPTWRHDVTYRGDAILVVDVGHIEAEHMLIVRVLFPRTGSDLGQMGTRRGQGSFNERGWNAT